MQELIALLTLVGDALGKLLKGRRRDREEVGALFHTLAEVFNAFPKAKAAQDQAEMLRLASETKGLLAGLKKNAALKRVLAAKTEIFLSDIEKVSNAKMLLVKGDASKQLQLIITAAGFFEGYAKSLTARKEIEK